MSEPVPAISEEAPPAAGRWRYRAAGWLVALLLRLIGRTLRVTVSIEEGGPPRAYVPAAVYSFWHRCILTATWHFRDLGVGVMTSRSKDGEYIARTIEHFGFLPVRGSSSRGGARGLLEMRRLIEAGHAVAFTIDGPRGPKYVAKPGPVLLARSTGQPMFVFHFAVADAWVLNTWDDFMIPQPFSRVLLRVSRSIVVPPDGDDAAMRRCHEELQSALDRVRLFAEENLRKLTRDAS